MARAIEVGGDSNLQLVDVRAISAQTALGMVGSGDLTVTVRNSLLSGITFSVTAPDLGSKLVNIHTSQLEGTVSSNGASSTVSVGVSQLDGAASAIDDGTINCVSVYTGGFVLHGCNPP